IHLALKYFCRWVGSELIHDERICGPSAVCQKKSPKAQRQQMTFIDLHVSDFSESLTKPVAKLWIASNSAQSAPVCWQNWIFHKPHGTSGDRPNQNQQ